jgi:glycosyltransferase involved in cell wall biosynthesis
VKWVKRFKNIEVTGHLSKDEYARKVQESKLALFPNRLDASPRVIPQCLACNVPVIVNKDIYGGLQYVTEKTGAAVPVKDFLKVIPELLRRYDQFQEARTFYLDNFGFYTTAHKLAQFVNKQFQTNYTLLYSEEDGYYKQFFTPPSLI